MSRLSKTKETAAAAPAFKRPEPPSKTTYPRRLTLDLDIDRKDRLDDAAHDARMPMMHLLRGAVTALLDDPAFLTAAIEAAKVEHAPDEAT